MRSGEDGFPTGSADDKLPGNKVGAAREAAVAEMNCRRVSLMNNDVSMIAHEHAPWVDGVKREEGNRRHVQRLCIEALALTKTQLQLGVRLAHGPRPTVSTASLSAELTSAKRCQKEHSSTNTS